MIRQNLLMFLCTLFFCVASYFLYTQVSGNLPHQDVDSQAYLANAQLFVQNNSFAWPESAAGKYPYYTLGYAFVLALLFKIFGAHNFIIVLVQVLVSLLCALLSFDITRRIAGSTAGVIAYFLTCINLGFLVFTQFILAEVWLAFFLILFFHRFVTYLQTKGLFTLTQAALALSLSVLIKPAALYFWPLLIPCFWLTAQKSFKRFFSAFLLWCAVFYLPIAGYALHNKLVFDRWYVCALDHENMIYWFFPNVLSYKYSTDQNIERLQLRALTQSQVHEKFMYELLHSPHLFVIVWLKNVAKTWFGLFTTNLKVLIESSVHGGDISYFKTKGSLMRRVHAYITAGSNRLWVVGVGYFEAIWLLLRLIFCFLGLLVLVQKHRWLLLYCIGVYIAYFSLITGHDGCARFRMLFEWLLIVMVALGTSVLISKMQAGVACSNQKA